VKLSSPYRPDIDGLRALAVLSVMVFHLNKPWLPGGFMGVDVFFVISGFVVTSSLTQSTASNFWHFITQFYARRLARIMPALLVVLLCTIICATLFIPQAWLSQLSEETARFAFVGLSNFKLEHNLDTYFAPRTEYNPYTHTWSLGVEEQFYLLAPLLVYFWLKAAQKRNLLGIKITQRVLMLAALVSLCLCIWATSAKPALAFYSIAARFWELAAGSLLFLVTSNTAATSPRLLGIKFTQMHSALIGMSLLLMAFVLANEVHFPWPWALAPVVGTLWLIGGAHLSPTDRIRSLLSKSLMVWIGKRSYSLYLWHWPIYVLLRWTVGLNQFWEYGIALVLTFLLSILSYRFVEQPLRHNRFLEKLPSILIVALFIGATGATYALATHILLHADRYSLSIVARNNQDWYRNGLTNYPEMTPYACLPTRETGSISGGRFLRLVPKSDCTNSRSSSSNQQIFVLGDSHADALFPIFEELSAQRSIPISIFAFAGCGFIDLRAPMAKGFGAGCNVFNQEITQAVLAKAKPGDVLILPSLRMKRFTDQWASFGFSNMQHEMYNEQAQALRKAALEDANALLKPFTDAHLKVVFIAPPPLFKSPTFRCADWFNAHNPICEQGISMPKAELVQLRTPILEQMHVLEKQLPQIYLWDPFEVLCPEQTCNAMRNGRPLFFDGDHLSNYGNLVLYPNFDNWLNQKHILQNPSQTSIPSP